MKTRDKLLFRTIYPFVEDAVHILEHRLGTVPTKLECLTASITAAVIKQALAEIKAE
jgi:hypothetical protein